MVKTSNNGTLAGKIGFAGSTVSQADADRDRDLELARRGLHRGSRAFVAGRWIERTPSPAALRSVANKRAAGQLFADVARLGGELRATIAPPARHASLSAIARLGRELARDLTPKQRVNVALQRYARRT